MKTTNFATTQKVFKLEDTILIVTATTEGCAGRKYVSVTANEIQPILRSEAVDRVREGLEDGELWRMAVEAEQTELGLTDWIEYVIGIDGELAGFDNSLYPKEISIDGEDYIFDSRSCGCLHDDIKQATNLFNGLIALHLSENTEDAELIINSIKSDDIDAKVLSITKKLISQTA